jgi:hypothetical protein
MQQESSVIGLRESFQYGTKTRIEDSAFAKLVTICQRAIDETKNIVYENE